MNNQKLTASNSSSTDIKAIIFDYGDVLNAPIDPEAVQIHRTNLARQLGLEPGELWQYLFGGPEAQKWLTGRSSWEAYWAEILYPRGVIDPTEVKAFSDAIFDGTNQLNPDMVQLLHELKGHYKLAVLSNASWTENEMAKMFYNDFGLESGIFDVIVSSTTVGVAKPHREIFIYTLRRLGIGPEEAVFTDDMPDFVKAAAELGIRARIFVSPADFRSFLTQLGILNHSNIIPGNRS